MSVSNIQMYCAVAGTATTAHYQVFEVVKVIFSIWGFLWTRQAVFNLFHLFLLRLESPLTSSDTTVFLTGDDSVASVFSLSEPSSHPCFRNAETACVSYSVNVMDTFPLWSQPIPTVTDMEISGKENTNVN